MTAPTPAVQATKQSVMLTVNDLTRSITFYEGLGLAIVERWENEGKLLGVMMGGGSAAIALTQDDFAKGRDRVKGVGVRIWIDTTQDVDQLAASARSAGVKLDGDPETMPWGARAFAVTDPDGFKVTFSREA